MVFIGMDHGTTGISFCIMSDEGEVIEVFKIGREESKKGLVSATEEIMKRVDLDSVKLMAITYAMGDGINQILPTAKVENRGILSINGAGKVTGGGTSVFSELESLDIDSIMIPGLHKDSDSLNELFRAAYSHQASPEKVSICYNAYKETGWSNFIVADISSNSVDILIEDGKIKGAMDACLGAMGVVHGPIDLEMIRDIDEGRLSANECFSHAGAVKIADIDTKVANMKDILLENYKNGDEKAILAINTLIMTVAMEIAGLDVVCENEIEGIVLTGSIGSATEPFNFEDEINKYFKNKYPLKVVSKESGAIGAAQIAMDVYNGKEEILGIEVNIS
ncbi:MAG: methanogenesis marker 12 protein [Methanobrevibacter sp.]|uniref:methanogenesis marker 12 protein n=1 Tax=Methanobrevibacter TaxID=2172 RepID=UPI0025D26052|nr:MULTISPECIES: methanogenesis marker 12 protein [Methanobrevibacter]MBS7258564.1 methanogenesis marker 12 protein [Methanobrevibacter sp.]MCI7428779.1 methanogenesis marker 12 protein [Methanobrevibacter sp.]MDD6777252.1 methanogenesis marker 12 protein [Methanobacteriaceae archaeon]MDY3097007.1 methanogenesis marker 12 protein [Methanobrevibacter sp.]